MVASRQTKLQDIWETALVATQSFPKWLYLDGVHYGLVYTPEGKPKAAIKFKSAEDLDQWLKENTN